jgi:hypothetical protein
MLRTCIGCEQTDDHPKHVIALSDGNEVAWHNDCHAIATGCAVCAATAGSADGLKGDKLREHIVSGGAADAVAAVMGEDI